VIADDIRSLVAIGVDWTEPLVNDGMLFCFLSSSKLVLLSLQWQVAGCAASNICAAFSVILFHVSTIPPIAHTAVLNAAITADSRGEILMVVIPYPNVLTQGESSKFQTMKGDLPVWTFPTLQQRSIILRQTVEEPSNGHSILMLGDTGWQELCA